MKFLSFITKVNPNNRNETKSDIFTWDRFKSDTISFLPKSIKVCQRLSKSEFSVLWLKWIQTMGRSKIRHFSTGHVQIWHQYLFIKKYKSISMTFKISFSVLWLKWTQRMERKQNQTFFHETCSNLTSTFFMKRY